jgi:hypothetical protein
MSSRMARRHEAGKRTEARVAGGGVAYAVVSSRRLGVGECEGAGHGLGAAREHVRAAAGVVED